VNGRSEDVVHARWAHVQGRSRGGDDEGAKAEQEEDLGGSAVDAGEKHGDDDDRPELAGHSRAQHGGAEARRQQARVAEDRDERAKRRRRERDADHPPFGVETRSMQQDADDEPAGDRDCPARRPAHELLSGNALLHDLEPREEEEEMLARNVR
jgi:hypothetical protein